MGIVSWGLHFRSVWLLAMVIIAQYIDMHYLCSEHCAGYSW